MNRVVRRLASNRGRATASLMLIAMLALTMSGCDVIETDTPQNTFDTRGEVADKQAEIFYVAMWPALVVMFGVLGGILLIALRYRERDPNSPPPRQIHGNTRLEVAWTIAPAVLLLIIGVPMVALIGDIDADADDDAYTIDVIGQRYSWIFEYPEELDDEGNPLMTFDNVAHIPVDRQVNFRLRSVDVIHSFWVPKLGGKRDVFPCLVANEDADPMDVPDCEGGQLNELWLVADEPGTFAGQCAEYCGLEHANMALTVIADEDEDFEAWVEEAQGGGGGEPAEEDATPEVDETASPEAEETPESTEGEGG